jgi:hypothetical protein
MTSAKASPQYSVQHVVPWRMPQDTVYSTRYSYTVEKYDINSKITISKYDTRKGLSSILKL